MKIYILAFLSCLSGNTISNSVCANHVINPGSVTAAIKAFKNLKVSEFIRLSPKDYSKITGKKMNLVERISFSIMKIRMKQSLKKNPNMKASEYIVEHKKMATVWWIVIVVVVVLIILAILTAIAAASAVNSTANALASEGCGFGSGG